MTENLKELLKRSGKKQTDDNFYEKDDTFKFTIHVSVAQRPSSVESIINLTHDIAVAKLKRFLSSVVVSRRSGLPLEM